MNYYEQIKTELINNEVYKKAKDYSKNKSDLNTYYNVGKLLFDAGKHYGEGIIKQYSQKLIKDVGKKYNERTLRRIRQYYKIFGDEKWSPMATVLSWSHYQELLVLSDENEIKYYINLCIKNHLTRNTLREKIKLKEYERLDEETENKLIKNEELEIKDLIKNPIVIKNKYDTNKISEKMLQKLILEDIESFMKELGNGYSFIGSEYKIKLGNTYNYIDILLFNYIYNAFIVLELKVTELKKEHIGQCEIYMNYIDENIKTINQNKTIGIIICRENNEFIIRYSSDKRILSKEFVLS